MDDYLLSTRSIIIKGVNRKQKFNLLEVCIEIRYFYENVPYVSLKYRYAYAKYPGIEDSYISL